MDAEALRAAVPELIKMAFVFPLIMLLNSTALEGKFDVDLNWNTVRLAAKLSSVP